MTRGQTGTSSTTSIKGAAVDSSFVVRWTEKDGTRRHKTVSGKMRVAIALAKEKVAETGKAANVSNKHLNIDSAFLP